MRTEDKCRESLADQLLGAAVREIFQVRRQPLREHERRIRRGDVTFGECIVDIAQRFDVGSAFVEIARDDVGSIRRCGPHGNLSADLCGFVLIRGVERQRRGSQHGFGAQFENRDSFAHLAQRELGFAITDDFHTRRCVQRQCDGNFLAVESRSNCWQRRR